MQLNLRRRLAVALFGLTSLGAGVLAITLWAGHYWLENRTLDDVLTREMEVYIEGNTRPSQVDTTRTGLHLFRPRLDPRTPLPRELRGLEPGSYRDYRFAGSVHHVLVRDAGPGDRVWLAYNVRAFERRETWLLTATAGLVVLIALLAWALSGPLSQRLLAPLHGLAGRLRTLDWNQRQHRLQPAAADEDLETIITALNRLLAEVDELMQRERAFASAAAHELRTPLASIAAAAELLSAVAPSEPAERIGRAVTDANGQLHALLALSRSRQMPDSEALRLDRCLPEFADAYRRAAPDCALHFALAPATVHAPRAVLETVFTNLLRNALAAAAHGRVDVTADADAVVIRDTGKGIAAELLPKMFEPGIKGRDGGSGMGLYIARVLAERAGWRVSAHNRKDAEGTEAVIRFR